MNLNDLKQVVPYKWKIQTFSKFKPKGTCVAYIDARDCMDLLDKVCGPDSWSTAFRVIDNKLFCEVTIFTENGWVSKSDCGTEGNIEKDKAQVSDALKRTCVQWGIGRFLYSIPIAYVEASCIAGGQTKPHVVDSGGNRVWDLTKHLNAKKSGPGVPLKPPLAQSQPLSPKIRPTGQGDSEEDIRVAFWALCKFNKWPGSALRVYFGSRGELDVEKSVGELSTDAMIRALKDADKFVAAIGGTAQ